MVQYDPEKRISIEEIKNHKWITEKRAYSKEELEKNQYLITKNEQI